LNRTAVRRPTTSPLSYELPKLPSALAARLIVSASNIRLKTKESRPCAVTVLLRTVDFTVTSDTCDVIPITKAKYRKSQ